MTNLNKIQMIAGCFLGILLISFFIFPANLKAAIIHADDVIIRGGTASGLCVGIDCVDGEVFGFDSIRLKENNLRMHFYDTSASAGFPSNDWGIIINDTASGGANKFSIFDYDHNTTPFTIEAIAGNHSLYVDDGGRVGLGTNSPTVKLHAVYGNTPALRLDQDGTSGWSPQIWDVAGNEANFFIRDVTHGSALPFRIIPGAPGNSIYIASGGNVGTGTSTPTAPLHVRRADGTAKLLVEEVNAAVAARTLFELKNAGNTKFAITNTDAGNTWAFTNSGTDFRISLQDSGVVEMIVDNSGNLVVAGTSTATNHVNTSSRSVKHGFQEVAQDKILEKVTQLPISSWQYNEGDSGNRHIGPVAEDFQAIFGLGDGKHISTVDTDGIALAAIQGLKMEQDQRQAQNNQELAQLKMENQRLQAELANLLELVQRLVTQDVVASID